MDAADAARVLALRREMPWAGRMPLALEVAARHPEHPLGEATVGRSLGEAVRKGKAPPCSFCEGRVAAARRRAVRPRDDAHRRPHIQEFPGRVPAQRGGSATQTLAAKWALRCARAHCGSTSLRRRGARIRGVCPRTRRQYAKVFPTATAHIAKACLDEAAERLDIRAVQVDGGAESWPKFEAACKPRGVPLLVPPPRSPELNGIVERANRTVRIEC